MGIEVHLTSSPATCCATLRKTCCRCRSPKTTCSLCPKRGTTLMALARTMATSFPRPVLVPWQQAPLRSKLLCCRPGGARTSSWTSNTCTISRTSWRLMIHGKNVQSFRHHTTTKRTEFVEAGFENMHCKYRVVPSLHTECWIVCADLADHDCASE